MPYHKLDVYQKAYQKALEVHKISLGFPKNEQYELAKQLRMSTKSIPANIAEGMGKQASPADVMSFMRIALGSCDETRVWLDFSRDLGYINRDSYDKLHENYCEIGRMINGIIRRYSKV